MILGEGDRVVLKLASGTGFNSRWELKSNFPVEKDANAENLGLMYGVGTFIVAVQYRTIDVISKPTFVEGGMVDED